MKIKRILIIAGVVLGVLVLLTLWTYVSGSNDPLTRGLKKIYPAALVGHGMISIHDWEQNLALAKKIDSRNVENARNHFIEVKKREVLAQKLRLDLESQKFEEEAAYYKFGREEEYNKILRDYFGGSERLFTQFVIRPRGFDAELRMKYNTDLNTNRDAHTRAQNILAKVTSGGKFEDVAKTDSDDKVTGQIGGDLGFAQIEEFAPELRNAILSSKKGEVNRVVVITRFGYHIIYPVETAEKDGKQLWHVKHILVATPGYDLWLDSQLKRIGVWRIR